MFAAKFTHIDSLSPLLSINPNYVFALENLQFLQEQLNCVITSIHTATGRNALLIKIPHLPEIKLRCGQPLNFLERHLTIDELFCTAGTRIFTAEHYTEEHQDREGRSYIIHGHLSSQGVPFYIAGHIKTQGERTQLIIDEETKFQLRINMRPACEIWHKLMAIKNTYIDSLYKKKELLYNLISTPGAKLEAIKYIELANKLIKVLEDINKYTGTNDFASNITELLNTIDDLNLAGKQLQAKDISDEPGLQDKVRSTSPVVSNYELDERDEENTDEPSLQEQATSASQEVDPLEQPEIGRIKGLILDRYRELDCQKPATSDVELCANLDEIIRLYTTLQSLESLWCYTMQLTNDLPIYQDVIGVINDSISSIRKILPSQSDWKLHFIKLRDQLAGQKTLAQSKKEKTGEGDDSKPSLEKLLFYHCTILEIDKVKQIYPHVVVRLDKNFFTNLLLEALSMHKLQYYIPLFRLFSDNIHYMSLIANLGNIGLDHEGIPCSLLFKIAVDPNNLPFIEFLIEEQGLNITGFGIGFPLPLEIDKALVLMGAPSIIGLMYTQGMILDNKYMIYTMRDTKGNRLNLRTPGTTNLSEEIRDAYFTGSCLQLAIAKRYPADLILKIAEMSTMQGLAYALFGNYQDTSRIPKIAYNFTFTETGVIEWIPEKPGITGVISYDPDIDHENLKLGLQIYPNSDGINQEDIDYFCSIFPAIISILGKFFGKINYDELLNEAHAYQEQLDKLQSIDPMFIQDLSHNCKVTLLLLSLTDTPNIPEIVNVLFTLADFFKKLGVTPAAIKIYDTIKNIDLKSAEKADKRLQQLVIPRRLLLAASQPSNSSRADEPKPKKPGRRTNKHKKRP